MPDAVIEMNNVWKIFGADADAAMEAVRTRNISKTDVLREFNCVVGIADVSFLVEKGEIFCVMGLSGSGKSTLVRHLNRLIEPTAGSITVLGQDIISLSDADLREVRARHIGMVFQHMALLPHRTVRDNVAFPLQVRGEPKSRRWAISQRCLDRVDLTGYEDRFPRELSGGMQQRVGLARALASDPDILLMDEPFAALDALTRRQMQEELLQLWEDTHFTVLFVTHSIEEACIVGSRILVMSPHPGQVKAELNAHHLGHGNVGEEEFSGLQQRIHDMLFADRILEEEAAPHA